VCGGDSHCFEHTSGKEMGFGKDRQGLPIVKLISGVVCCMGAVKKGIASDGPHRVCNNGYVQHGIYMHRKIRGADGRGGVEKTFAAARVGKSGGTFWYLRGSDETDAPVVAVSPEEVEKRRKREEQSEAYRAKADLAKRMEWNARYTAACRRGQNHPVLRAYLEGRGIPVDQLPGGVVPGCLALSDNTPRQAPVADKKDDADWGKPGPAMLAALIDPHGEHWNTHRTYLAIDGEPVKRKSGMVRLVAGSVGEGTSVHLSEDWTDDSTLALCEGIESGLAALAGVRASGGGGLKWNVWACRACDGLMNFKLPEGITKAEGGPVARLVWLVDLDSVRIYDEKQPKTWHRPGVDAAIRGAMAIAETHPDLPQFFAMATPEWLPEGVSPGAFDGLGELAAKADGTARKSIDPDDALAILIAQRTSGDKVAAARILGEGLRASLRGWKEVAEQIDKAREAAEKELKGVGATGAMAAGGGGEKSGGKGAGKAQSTKHKGGKRRSDEVGGATEGEEGKDEGEDAGERDDEEGSVGDGGTPQKNLGDGTGNNGPKYRILPKCRFARARIVLDELYRPGGEWPREPGDHCMDPTWAKQTRARLADGGERWTLIHWLEGDRWMVYQDGAYRELKEAELECRVGDYLAEFRSMTDKKKIKACALSEGAIKDVIAAMKSEVLVRSDRLPTWAPATFDQAGIPIWHTMRRGAKASGPEVVPTKSGLICIESLKKRELVVLPLTPRYVCVAVLPHELPIDELRAAIAEDAGGEERLYTLARKYAPEWMTQIVLQADGDTNWDCGLQRFFGLLLTSDMRFKKALLLVGVSGTLKGTIMAGMQTCHHKSNIAIARYDDMTRPFQAADWLGKGILCMDEMQAGRMSDKAATASRIKNLITERSIFVDMKHKDAMGTYDHTLRLVMSSDRMPEFIDPAGAMRRRLIVITCTKQYEGDADETIRERIEQEGKGILIWSLGGLIDLYRAGRLCMPETGMEYLNRLVRESSKPSAFIEDCCEVDKGSAVDIRLVCAMYSAWCEFNGMKCPARNKIFEGLAATVDRLREMPLEKWAKVAMPTTPVVTTDSMGRQRRVIVGLRPRLAKEGKLPGKSALVVSRETVYRAPAVPEDKSPWARGDQVMVMDWDSNEEAETYRGGEGGVDPEIPF